MNHLFYLLYFDLDGKHSFLPLLDACIASYIQAELPRENLRILTTASSFLSEVRPQYVPIIEMVPVPEHYLEQYYRVGVRGSQFDYKACVIMEFCRTPKAQPFVIMDIDNQFMRDFSQDWSALVEDSYFYIGKDPGQRMIYTRERVTVPEESSSILVFPKNCDVIASTYRHVWDNETIAESVHWLREQRTWSQVNYHFRIMGRADILPRDFSWSRLDSANGLKSTLYPNMIAIRHYHGTEKWEWLHSIRTPIILDFTK